MEAPTPQAWAASHAALPVADPCGPEGFDLYYSARDKRNRSHVGRARVAVRGDRLEVEGHDPEPLLTPGSLGAFDDCGVTTSCIVRDGDRVYLYYTGWTLARTVPFHFFVGLAVSNDGGRTFARVSPAPILGRSAVDPFLTASPWVLRDGGTWRMWYVSCIGWEAVRGGARHRYHIRSAASDDGVVWRADGRVAIDFGRPEEYAMGRPCVILEGGRYRMWFCARGDAYRLAYAESADGLDWTRRDAELELVPPPAGWDGEMQAYPAVVRAGSLRHMLYNGSGFGRSGIGYATEKSSA